MTKISQKTGIFIKPLFSKSLDGICDIKDNNANRQQIINLIFSTNIHFQNY